MHLCSCPCITCACLFACLRLSGLLHAVCGSDLLLVSLSACLPDCLFVSLFVVWPLLVRLFVCLSVCLFVCVFVCSSFCLTRWLAACHCVFVVSCTLILFVCWVTKFLRPPWFIHENVREYPDEFFKPLLLKGYAYEETVISPQRFGKPMNRLDGVQSNASLVSCACISCDSLQETITTWQLGDFNFLFSFWTAM